MTYNKIHSCSQQSTLTARGGRYTLLGLAPFYLQNCLNPLRHKCNMVLETFLWHFAFMKIFVMRLCRTQEVDHVSHLPSVSHLQLHHWMLARGGLLHLRLLCYFWLWVFSHISLFNFDDALNTDLWPETPSSEFKQEPIWFFHLFDFYFALGFFPI